MTKTELQLIDKQLPAQQRTAKDLVKMTFGRDEIYEGISPELQLRNLLPEVRNSGLGYIISNVAILSGFKGEIPEINKDDISELLMTRFQTIGLHELNYAFKLDRHGYHGEPTSHFQLFNAEYVSRVLNRYLIYKAEIRKIPKKF